MPSQGVSTRGVLLRCSGRTTTRTRSEKGWREVRAAFAPGRTGLLSSSAVLLAAALSLLVPTNLPANTGIKIKLTWQPGQKQPRLSGPGLMGALSFLVRLLLQWLARPAMLCTARIARYALRLARCCVDPADTIQLSFLPLGWQGTSSPLFLKAVSSPSFEDDGSLNVAPNARAPVPEGETTSPLSPSSWLGQCFSPAPPPCRLAGQLEVGECQARHRPRQRSRHSW